jgi:hypothetical protein
VSDVHDVKVSPAEFVAATLTGIIYVPGCTNELPIMVRLSGAPVDTDGEGIVNAKDTPLGGVPMEIACGEIVPFDEVTEIVMEAEPVGAMVIVDCDRWICSPLEGSIWITVCLAAITPSPLAATTIGASSISVEAEAVRVSSTVAVPCDERVIGLVLQDAVTPSGSPETFRSTDP